MHQFLVERHERKKDRSKKKQTKSRPKVNFIFLDSCFDIRKKARWEHFVPTSWPDRRRKRNHFSTELRFHIKKVSNKIYFLCFSFGKRQLVQIETRIKVITRKTIVQVAVRGASIDLQPFQQIVSMITFDPARSNAEEEQKKTTN